MEGVLPMKDVLSRIRMGPQRAVAGGGTSKSGGSTDKAIHAILSSSLTHVLQLFVTLSCPWRPPPQLSHCSYISIPHFFNQIFIIFGLFLLIFFNLIFPPTFSLRLLLDCPFFRVKFRCCWFISLYFLQFDFLHSGRMANFLAGHSETGELPAWVFIAIWVLNESQYQSFTCDLTDPILVLIQGGVES